MSDKTELANDDAPRTPVYTEGDVVQHKASKQTAIILCARGVVIHDKSCPYAQPFAGLALNLPLCGCSAIFTGEYTMSISLTEEIVVDEYVLEPVL